MKKNFETFFYEINSNDSELYSLWNETKKERSLANEIAITIILLVDILIFMLLGNGVIEIFTVPRSLSISAHRIFPLIFLLVFTLIIDTVIYIIIGAIFSRKKRKYNNEYKEKIIDNLLKNFFNDVDYIPKKLMPEQIYKEGQYEIYDNYYSDDYMEAYINEKYSIKMAEVKTEEERRVRDSEGNYHTERITIFSGLFAKINIGKSINSDLRVTNNRFFSRENKLNMDSQEFEKCFDVSATDKIIGMQLLTHDVMDLLINFKRQLGKNFDFFVKKDVIYIRLHVGSMFEAKFNKNEVVDKSMLQMYYDVINFISRLAQNLIEIIETTQL